MRMAGKCRWRRLKVRRSFQIPPRGNTLALREDLTSVRLSQYDRCAVDLLYSS